MSAHELRNESRIRSRGRFEILLDGSDPISATLWDVSPSGLCLETKAPVNPGTAVQLESAGFIADAVVRYCRQEGEVCKVGVALSPAK